MSLKEYWTARREIPKKWYENKKISLTDFIIFFLHPSHVACGNVLNVVHTYQVIISVRCNETR